MSTTNNFIIPLVNTPQAFDITLGVNDYNLTCYWCDIAQCWFLDIADTNDNSLACGLPLITGADMLAGLEYLEIPGKLICYTNGNEYAIPTLDNLGIDSNLYFQTVTS